MAIPHPAAEWALAVPLRHSMAARLLGAREFPEPTVLLPPHWRPAISIFSRCDGARGDAGCAGTRQRGHFIDNKRAGRHASARAVILGASAARRPAFS